MGVSGVNQPSSAPANYLGVTFRVKRTVDVGLDRVSNVANHELNDLDDPPDQPIVNRTIEPATELEIEDRLVKLGTERVEV